MVNYMILLILKDLFCLVYFVFQSNIKIQNMALLKSQPCNPAHQKEFEYCCIPQNKVFCSKCWFKSEHSRICLSSRCGDYKKLAHLVVNRALQLKNVHYLQNMSSSYQKYQLSRVRFLQLNYQITQLLKKWVDQKVPLFLWTMTNDMLQSKYSNQSGLHCNKFDGICIQMLKSIKDQDPLKKPDYLQMAISNFHTIDHELKGKLTTIKSQQTLIKDATGKQQQINQVIEHCSKNVWHFLSKIQINMKTMIQKEIGELIKNFDQDIKYKGVMFQLPKKQVDLFKRKQSYRHMNLNCQLFSKSVSSNNSGPQIYNGFNLSPSQLQTSPELILQVSKSFLKQKLFTMHSQIQNFKSSFPYKYVYPIVTCLQPDEQYQILVLQLEAAGIKQMESKAKIPYHNSGVILLMGSETIVVRFINSRTDFNYSIKIYGYKKQRENYYTKVKEIFGLTSLKLKSKYHQNFIPYTQNSTLLQLAYCNFRIAYQQIFTSQTDEQIFEGQRVTANRGMQLLNEVMDKWKSKAKIQLPITIPKQQIIQLII